VTVAGETDRARTFVLLAAPGAIIAWQVSFEYGAFDTLDHQRVFSILVISAVVLAATFIAPDTGVVSSTWSRAILAVPLLTLLADMVLDTDSGTVSWVLDALVVLTLPYVLWVVARLMGVEFFGLPRREQVAAIALVVVIGVLGFYVGSNNERFLTCRDFERIGDYEPEGCAP